MKLTNLLASASLLGAAAVAAPAKQAHQHKDKRAVVTTTVHTQVTVVVTAGQQNAVQTNVVETDEVETTNVAAINENVVLGSSNNNNNNNQANTEATQATTQANTEETVEAAQQASTKPASTEVESSPVASTQAASTQAASTQAASTKSSASSGDFSASAKGICYTPYTDQGGCKSSSEVASDLQTINSYSTLRLYGTDCNQVANVMQAKASGQKLFLGIYDVSDIQGSVDAIKSAVEAYGSWDDVMTVSVGNELVNGGQATPSQVGQYVATARAALSAAGYSGPVVAVDTFIAIINNPELCQYSDYMACNAHAYFDQYTTAQDAGPWVLEQIQRVYTTCGGSKSVTITETGWPSKGETYGVAVPSKQNQRDAIDSISQTCGNDVFLYTTFNDYWKADGPYGVEKYFGIYSSE
ncbi:hypothetical protein TBLA_0C07050 [Henningerozyma blattae CBS 6284]|uniref:Glycoside hydrolase family 17 protein n=1 Tax=Henningerozyma blattae (strain ATCC 34711 / CBS 6284 / DSM 70876 / NBRC 10599 / NRRL Y-10934 / UCD 77-7) TaxID=1071380 RepID=I2H294_HENB6|nr:hypothetical protein TBLA_0C07050 [Tetrapisispora blattae CBS 6284]CCH60496.1 hypothetical protein TBLA_0C07050 [Tetrapisispora blattae CBS 6284]